MTTIPPSRHMIVEKILDKKIVRDKYLLGPGGCFWLVDVNQCLLSQWFYVNSAPSVYYFNSENTNKPQAIPSRVIRLCLEDDSHFFFLGQKVSVFSSLKLAEEFLYNSVIPNRILSLEKRIFSQGLRADRKVKIKILLARLKKKLKKQNKKLNYNA